MHDMWKQGNSGGEAGPDPTWCGRGIAVRANMDYEKCFKYALIFKRELSEFCFMGLFIPWVTVLPSETGNVTQKAEANQTTPMVLVICVRWKMKPWEKSDCSILSHEN